MINFNVKENLFEPSFAEYLQQKYCTMDREWHERTCGRFIGYLDVNDAEDFIEMLYNNEQVPFYKNKAMARGAHIYVNAFGPGSILPEHTEETSGGLTYYMQTFPDNAGSKMHWFESESELKSLEFDYHAQPKNTVTPEFNKAVYWYSTTKQPEFNNWHRIGINTSDQTRYSIQMFYSNTGTISSVSRQYNKSTNHTAGTISNNTLKIYNIPQSLQFDKEWKEQHVEYRKLMCPNDV